ncbi:MAG: XisI protein [Okeania sp. SIO3B5]|uniref:XisI protein n=1 Tax=Okeania sp. SIO3B5 TaxID=2607811 RepID=UPI0013FF25E0|nr:XisI protein [Okeania sp. SIO3B5]NEO54138.1 XisI protein [Okeania sp. SIO3B5]
MDKLNKYRTIIKKFLTEQTQGNSLDEDIETEIVFDQERERYLLIDLGWQKHQRIYNCVIHLEIKNEKIWIQRNQTDLPISDRLIAEGVPPQDIVLGLQPAYVREYTGLGV